MTLGEIIHAYRKENKISMDDFARQSGISKAYISILERNNNPISQKPPVPSLDKIRSAGSAMGKTLDEMLALMGDSESVSLRTADPLPPSSATPIDTSKLKRIPILGKIAAGVPIYAEENIEGYTYTDLNGGHEYFALRVRGDSMNALGINDGYIIIVRKQESVDNGDVAVVLVDMDSATVKRFYQTDNTVTLMPQSLNPAHKPQIYDLATTNIQILGKVVKVEFTL